MKKRILALLFICLMLATSVLSGCNKTDGSDVNSDSKETGSKDKASNDSEEYPVIRMNYAIIFSNEDEKMIEDALNEIMREKAHAEVDLVGIEFANWVTQLNLMLTGGDDSLDIFTSFWYTSESNLVSNGQVMALDDLIQSDGQGILEQYAGYEDYLSCAEIDGKLYGIPTINPWVCENLYMTQRADAEAAGIDWDTVNDLDSMTDAMITLKETNPDKYYIPGSTETYWVPKSIDYLGDMNLFGVLTDPANSTTVEDYYKSEYFYDFLDHVEVWKENGLISPDPLSNSNPTLSNLLYGIANGTPGYNWDAQIGVENTSAQFGIDMVGTAINDCLATSGEVTTYMWHVSSFTKNPEAAMRVLNVLYSDADAAQILANGIEGVHYEVNENGQMVYPEGKTAVDLTWTVGSSMYFPNSTLCKTWFYEPVDLYEQMKEKRNTVVVSKALGFQFDSSTVANEITACSNVLKQYYMPLMYAEVDVEETLPIFQKALEDAGINVIIAEKQRQLDEWLASR
ncbi:MAG: ABC transporter substrate-binding protein [Eubacteriales bacterium]